MGKKCYRDSIGGVRIRVWTALRSNAGTEVIEPYRAPAPTLQLRATATAPGLLRPSSSCVGVVVGPGYGYYGPRFGFYRCAPILRPTRLLACSSSLAVMQNHAAAGADRGRVLAAFTARHALVLILLF